MFKFSDYLLENSTEHVPTVEIIFQGILDAVDYGHVEYGKDRIEFNVGNLLKRGALSSLNVVIRGRQESDQVRLAKRSSDSSWCIVIDIHDDLPARNAIDDFLSKGDDITMEFKADLANYLSNHHDGDVASTPHSHEVSKMINTRDGFESQFSQMIEQFEKENLEKYKQSLKHFTGLSSMTADHSKVAIHAMSIKHLKVDTIGNNYKEFVKILGKLTNGAWMSELGKEQKKILDSRLKSYYEAKLSSI